MKRIRIVAHWTLNGISDVGEAQYVFGVSDDVLDKDPFREKSLGPTTVNTDYIYQYMDWLKQQWPLYEIFFELDSR